MSNSPQITCPDCDGEGGQDILDNDGIVIDFIICESCEGTGKIEDFDYYPEHHKEVDPLDVSKEADIQEDLDNG